MAGVLLGTRRDTNPAPVRRRRRRRRRSECLQTVDNRKDRFGVVAFVSAAPSQNVQHLRQCFVSSSSSSSSSSQLFISLSPARRRRRPRRRHLLEEQEEDADLAERVEVRQVLEQPQPVGPERLRWRRRRRQREMIAAASALRL